MADKDPLGILKANKKPTNDNDPLGLLKKKDGTQGSTTPATDGSQPKSNLLPGLETPLEDIPEDPIIESGKSLLVPPSENPLLNMPVGAAYKELERVYGSIEDAPQHLVDNIRNNATNIAKRQADRLDNQKKLEVENKYAETFQNDPDVKSINQEYEESIDKWRGEITGRYQEKSKQELDSLVTSLQQQVDSGDLSEEEANQRLKTEQQKIIDKHDQAANKELQNINKRLSSESQEKIDKVFKDKYSDKFSSDVKAATRERDPIVSFGKTFSDTFLRQIPGGYHGFMASEAGERYQKAVKEYERLNQKYDDERQKVDWKRELVPGVENTVKAHKEYYKDKIDKFNQSMVKHVAKSEYFQDMLADEDVVNTLKEIKDPLDVVNYIFSNVGQAVAQIPTSLASFGTSTFVQEQGAAYMDAVTQIAEEKGMSPQEVIEQGLDGDSKKAADAVGSINMFLDMVGVGKVTGAFSKKLVRESLRKKTLQSLEGGVAEFGTEFLQSTTSQAGTALGQGKTPSIDLWQSFEEGAAGFVGSVPLGGAIRSSSNQQSVDASNITNQNRNAEEITQQTREASPEERIEGRQEEEVPVRDVEQGREINEEQRQEGEKIRKSSEYLSDFTTPLETRMAPKESITTEEKAISDDIIKNHPSLKSNVIEIQDEKGGTSRGVEIDVSGMTPKEYHSLVDDLKKNEGFDRIIDQDVDINETIGEQEDGSFNDVEVTINFDKKLNQKDKDALIQLANQENAGSFRFNPDSKSITFSPSKGINLEDYAERTNKFTEQANNQGFSGAITAEGAKQRGEVPTRVAEEKTDSSVQEETVVEPTQEQPTEPIQQEVAPAEEVVSPEVEQEAVQHPETPVETMSQPKATASPQEAKTPTKPLKQKKPTTSSKGREVVFEFAGSRRRGRIISQRPGVTRVQDSSGSIYPISDRDIISTEQTPKKTTTRKPVKKANETLQPKETTRKSAREKAEISNKVNTVIAKVQQAFPNISVITDREMMPEHVRDLPGAFVNGNIYINPEFATNDTPIHEFAHLWTGIAKQVNPYILKRVENEVRQTEQYQKLIDDPAYKDLTEDQLVEEAFVRIVSDKGVQKLSKTKIGKVFDQILDIIKRGLKKIGIDPGTNLTSLTLDKLSSKVAKEILTARPLTQASSVDIESIFNKHPNGAKLEVSNSIMTDSGNRFFRDIIRKHVNSQFKTSRGLSLKLRDDVEGFGNKISTVTQVMNIKIRHLKDLIKRYEKKNGELKTEQVIKDIGDAFSGNKPISELPGKFKPVMEDIMRQKRFFIDKLKENLILKGDVIGAFNHDLELYLTENFNRKESLDSVENQLLDKHKKEARELLSATEEQLAKEYEKLQNRNDKVDKDLLKTKLKELEGHKKLIETIQKDADAKTSKLIKDYKEAIVRLQEAQKMQGVEVAPNSIKDKEKSKLTKEVNKKTKEVEALLQKPEQLTTNQLNILEQIESINAAISDVMQESPKTITRKAAGKFLEQIQSKEIKQVKLQQDLGLVDFIQYKHQDGKFDITFNHKDGHQHNVTGIEREDMVSLIGESATRNMEFQETGIHKLTTPKILLNNPLYERIKKNDDKYVHRSYMLHDVKDFEENVKKHVGEEVYDKAVSFIRDRYEDHRVASIRKETSQAGEAQYVFKNVYGVESQPFTSKNIEKYLRDIGVKEKDIVSFRKTDSDIDFSLTSPTSYWNETGIDSFSLPDYRLQEIISGILDTNNFDNTFGNSSINNKVENKVFKKRKDIAKEIRDLMGEYMNPQITMAKTLVKGAVKAESDRFYMGFIQKGLNEGVVSETKTKFHTKKMSSEKLGVPTSKEYYTTPELYDFMFATVNGPGSFEKAWMTINGLVKMNFTVLRGASQTRNAIGAAENLWAATGDVSSFKRINESFKAVSQDFEGNEGMATIMSTPMFLMKLVNGKNFGNKGNLELQKMYQELAEEGIMNSNIEGAAARELAEIMQSSGDTKAFMSKVKEAARKPLAAASKVYQLSDAVFKAAQYFHEKDLYKKAGYSEQEARNIASNIVKNLQPHYDRAPRIFKALSRNPLGGSFVMFKAEMFRTRFNILKQGIKEVQSGNPVLKKAGWRRLGGLSSQSITSQAIRLTAMSLLGITDEEDEAVRWLMPEYSRNNALVYLDKDLRKPNYLDFTFIDPSSAYTNAAIALTSDREHNLLEGGKELFGDFFTSEIFTQNMFQIVSNQDDYGNPIVYETDDVDVKMAKWSAHASKALTPGEVKDMQKILESMIDPDKRGYKLSTRDEVMNRVLGIKMKERDLMSNYKWRNYDLKERLYQSRKIFNNNDKTRENYNDAKRKVDETFEQIKKGYHYIHLVGYNPVEVDSIIREYQLMPEYILQAVKDGYLIESDYGIYEEDITE